MLNKGKMKELMKDKYIKTVRELAYKSRVPYSTLNRMLQGKDMHLSSVVQLAKCLEVPVDALIDKSYFMVSYTDTEVYQFETCNFLEVTLQIMLQTKGIQNMMLSFASEM